MLTKRWERLKTKPSEIDRLKLLARLELTADQAQRALKMDAASVSAMFQKHSGSIAKALVSATRGGNASIKSAFARM